MAKNYTTEFKLEAVKRFNKTGKTIKEVAEELGINVNTLNSWIRRYRQNPECPFPGSGRLAPEDDKLRKLEKENRDLKEEIEILKKAAVYFAKNQK